MLRTLMAAAVAAVLPFSAFAQAPCVPREVMLERLKNLMGEEPQWAGLTSNGAWVELHGVVGGGSWTITVTGPGGKTCMIVTDLKHRSAVNQTPPPNL